MADQEHLDILKQGVDVWNAWRGEHPFARPNLIRANLMQANLRGALLNDADLIRANLSKADLNGGFLRRADLTDADLSRTNLSEAFLHNTHLSGADLSGSNLRYADLMLADLSRVDLGGANLSGADLSGVDFSAANLTGADFSEAEIGGTTFGYVDLSTVKGLETITHEGPSLIGIDTIYRSQGKIPEKFLREAGIPDTFLEYMHSLVGKPIRYFTCFISHSHKDQRFCDRLYADLRHHDVPSWYFPEDAAWGKSVWGEIDRSIKVYDKLVVVCSEYSLQSPAVLREIERVLQREDREDKHILFPLRLDNYLFEQWEHERKADVVNKVAGDFRDWRNADKYEKAFQRFLRALKAEEEPTS